jgi:ArsR family transcriptional regulator, arsenate/arsenite/antimonite-responsive transcriptional repressor
MNPEDVTRLLTALGDQNRQAILMLLGEKKRLNVGEIASHFAISRPAISHHLKIMKDAHILVAEKQGQETYYMVDGEKVIQELETVVAVIASCIRYGKPPDES